MTDNFIVEKQDTITRYNLPKEVRFCTRCTISNQRPRITFDKNGVCSACNYADFKKTLDWEKREAELQALCDRHRRSDGSYDVIVPVSGGKDGGFVAHQLKYVYGMNPLTVTWAPHLSTDIGRQNLENFINSGFDNIYGRPNGQIHQLMTRLSFQFIGDPFQPFIYGQTNFPLRMAVQHGIQLIMYGENGEVEYGGDMKNAFRPTREITDHKDHYFSGIPPEAWLAHGITPQNLHAYMAPQFAQIMRNQTEIHFFGYYKYWDPQENFYYCSENTGFRPNPERTEGTYSKYASLDDKLDGFHYYLAYIKFGIGRATSDTAHEIRDGKITREEGIALVRKYDGEFTKKYYQTFLDYCGLSDEQFHRVIDSWRSDHLWKKNEGVWSLRHAIWQETDDNKQQNIAA
ncbi:MAG: N-acetyl sugar amidotransferase [Magnetococcus sp. DMHC-6]